MYTCTPKWRGQAAKENRLCELACDVVVRLGEAQCVKHVVARGGSNVVQLDQPTLGCGGRDKARHGALEHVGHGRTAAGMRACKGCRFSMQDWIVGDLLASVPPFPSQRARCDHMCGGHW